MKNIVIMTGTLTRYDHIRRGMKDLSGGSLKITNNFFPIKTLSKFKRNQFLQILFPVPALLIIDKDIIVGKDISNKPLNLLEKIIGLGVLDKNTKILMLINREEIENNKSSNTILVNINSSSYLFPTFTFTENQKAEQIINPLFLKIKEILEN